MMDRTRKQRLEWLTREGRKVLTGFLDEGLRNGIAHWLAVRLTQWCNVQCPNCAAISQSSEWENMTLGEYGDFARALATFDVGILRVTGGEPTMHPRFEMLAAQMASDIEPVEFNLATNGLLLNTLSEATIRRFTNIFVTTHVGRTNHLSFRRAPNIYVSHQRHYWNPQDNPNLSATQAARAFGFCAGRTTFVVGRNAYRCCMADAIGRRDEIDVPHVSFAEPNWAKRYLKLDNTEICARCFVASDVLIARERAGR